MIVKQTSVLVYTRPWNDEQFRHLAENIWPGAEIHSASEHPSVDRCGLKDIFYKNLATDQTATSKLSGEQLNDVILRCRLLRALSPSDAHKLVLAMENAIRQVLSTIKPEFILSVTVDSYIIHLFHLIANELGVKFIGLVPTFVNGYFRITACGEKCGKRSVEAAEIETTLAMLLRQGYKPGFLVNTPALMRRRMVRNWFRNFPKPCWFWLRRMLSGDRWNYHYLSSQIVAVRNWSVLPRKYPVNRAGFETGGNKQYDGRPKIYFPLQLSPEATVDYWSKSTAWIEYEKRVLELLATYSTKAAFFVKEHPNVVGMRSKMFYQNLQQMACTLVPAEIDSNSVLETCDGIVVCTGSAGLEAALRGKLVYSDCAPFYLHPNGILPLQMIARQDSDHPDKQGSSLARNKIVSYLLEGLLPGHFINDGTWKKDSPKHIIANIEVASSIRSFLDGV